MGNFTAELNEKEAPITVASFAGLANGTVEWTNPKTGQKQKAPYYDGIIFHRVIDNFMIQGGDPLGSGTGGPGFTIKDEINNLKHDKAGVLAMARTPRPNSAGSQFYITASSQPGLDGDYKFFGVCEPLERISTLAAVPVDPEKKPLEDLTMISIEITRCAR